MRSALTKNGSTRRWREIRERVLRRDRGICQYGGGAATTVDHVLPRWMGGDDRLSNLKASCSRHQHPETRGTPCSNGEAAPSMHERPVTSPAVLPTLRGDRTRQAVTNGAG